jgi:hypothetical protein
LTGHIEGVQDGADVTVTFDGSAVGSGVAHSQNGEPTGSADITFTVPSDAGPGRHEVVFKGAWFSCSAGANGVGTGVDVLGEQIVKGANNVGAPLPVTGVEIVALVAAASVLILAGAQLVGLARLRRHVGSHTRSR